MTGISKLGFNILLVFAFIDGRYVAEEGHHIARYIRDRIRREHESAEMDKVAIYLDITIAYSSAIEYMKQFTLIANEEDKLQLIRAAYEVIGADNIIEVEERQLFNAMGNIFDMDLEPMLLPPSQFLN